MAIVAFSCVTTAHPAEPEKPDINSLLASHGAIYSEEWLSSDGMTGSSSVTAEVWGVHPFTYCRCQSYVVSSVASTRSGVLWN